MIELTSMSDEFDVAGGVAVAVANPRECDDFCHLIDKYVRVDGMVHHIIGVERAAHAPPWLAGEGIALLWHAH